MRNASRVPREKLKSLVSGHKVLTYYLTKPEESSHLICLTSTYAFVFAFVECCAEFVPSLTLECTRGYVTQTPGGTKGRGSRKMFWELVRGHGIGKPVACLETQET